MRWQQCTVRTRASLIRSRTVPGRVVGGSGCSTAAFAALNGNVEESEPMPSLARPMWAAPGAGGLSDRFRKTSVRLRWQQCKASGWTLGLRHCSVHGFLVGTLSLREENEVRTSLKFGTWQPARSMHRYSRRFLPKLRMTPELHKGGTGSSPQWQALAAPHGQKANIRFSTLWLPT